MQRLNKKQIKLAHQKQVGSSVIKGDKGSGKTAIGIARMIYLLEHVCKKDERVLFVSPKPETAERASAYLQEYYSHQNVSLFDEELRAEVVVRSMEELVEEGARKAFVCFNKKTVAGYPEEMVLTAVKTVKKTYPHVRWMREEQLAFLQHELDWMNANEVRSLEDYQEAKRKGTDIKLPKKGKGRKALWLLKETVEDEMKSQGLIAASKAAMETLTYLKEDCLKPCYSHMVIDDAEKLTKVEMEMLKALRQNEAGEALFLIDPAGENAFSFLTNGKGFKQAGFDMTGRSRCLRKKQAGNIVKKKVKTGLTPLEAFMLEMQSLSKPAPQQAEEVKKSSLPWYVETYEFVNKLTGTVTVFQKDSSAGETYIDEVKQEEVDVLPVYSDIAAGMPIEIVDEVSGRFEMPSQLLHHKKNTYILHVQGDSMIGAGISDGDYVVIQAGNVADHEIAAVYYNGATTLKRIVQEQDSVLLVSENPKYRPIVIEDGDFRVMGKLVGVIKPVL